MSDLISRQAAIDMFDGAKVDEGYFCNEYDIGYNDGIDFAVSKLSVLQSAQPEIIRCKDCKHGSPNGKYGCKCYHYTLYETHEMKPEDFCSRAERRRE